MSRAPYVSPAPPYMPIAPPRVPGPAPGQWFAAHPTDNPTDFLSSLSWIQRAGGGGNYLFGSREHRGECDRLAKSDREGLSNGLANCRNDCRNARDGLKAARTSSAAARTAAFAVDGDDDLAAVERAVTVWLDAVRNVASRAEDLRNCEAQLAHVEAAITKPVFDGAAALRELKRSLAEAGIDINDVKYALFRVGGSSYVDINEI